VLERPASVLATRKMIAAAGIVIHRLQNTRITIGTAIRLGFVDTSKARFVSTQY